MVSIILGFYKRKAGLSQEQFIDHWENIHGPVIKAVPDIEKYVVRYVQHRLTTIGAAGLEFDEFSETWFTDETARDRLFATPGFKETYADEEQFLDMDATRWIVVDDQNVVIK
jgi:uncharacterized protein (TIGR02118 family)